VCLEFFEEKDKSLIINNMTHFIDYQFFKNNKKRQTKRLNPR